MTKTVKDMIDELSQYPATARVLSYKAVVDTGSMRSTTTYSERTAKMLAARRAASA